MIEFSSLDYTTEEPRNRKWAFQESLVSFHKRLTWCIHWNFPVIGESIPLQDTEIYFGICVIHKQCKGVIQKLQTEELWHLPLQSSPERDDSHCAFLSTGTNSRLFEETKVMWVFSAFSAAPIRAGPLQSSSTDGLLLEPKGFIAKESSSATFAISTYWGVVIISSALNPKEAL